MRTIDDGERACRARHLRRRRNVDHFAEQVAHVRKRDDAAARPQQPRKLVQRRRGAVRAHAPPAHGGAAHRRRTHPRRDVGLVPRFGHDDLVARRKQRGRGVAEEMQQRGGGAAEDDAARVSRCARHTPRILRMHPSRERALRAHAPPMRTSIHACAAATVAVARREAG